jgi:predicted transcriptional regulator
MTNIRQEIALQLNAYEDIQALKNDAATLAGDRQRLAHYQETGKGVDHDRVTAWLSSIGTDSELPCPN